MAIDLPGLSLSIMRQQTTVQAGLPLLISGRFTAFGLGVPTFIRVFLEGPSYDPQIRSFDTFSSPFSGDYSVNVIAEKDGRYNVYAQASPPPLIPTGPPFPEAIMLLPPFAESTRPPLVVGIPFNGGVDALLPDGTREFLESPPLQPIEFRPIITVAPGVSVTAPGVPGAPTPIPYPAPPAPPAAPPPAPGVLEAIIRATIDDIRFSPEEIGPGVEAIGVMSWRNIGDEPHVFDIYFYMVSPVGARYGPLQVNRNVQTNPQVPNTQNLRLSTAGMPPGVYSVVIEIYDSTTGVLLTAMTLPGRLSIREIVVPVPVPPPVIPPPVPPPVVPPPVIPPPVVPDILGQPSHNLPNQINVGDVLSGTVSLPIFGTVPFFAKASLVMIGPSGYEYVVGQVDGTLSPGETLQIPVNLDTADFPAGDYSLFLMVYDQVGQLVGPGFPMGFLTLIGAIVPSELPIPLNVLPAPLWGGTVTKEPDKPLYTSGEIVQVTAHPIPGHKFDYWTLETGEFLSTASAIDFMVVTPHTLTARFSLIEAPTPVPTIPTAPTTDMFSTPTTIGLPTELEIGQPYHGDMTIPTYAPPALADLPSLPSLPVNIELQLRSPTGQMFFIQQFQPKFTPGQDIDLPIFFDTNVLSQEGLHDLVINIKDLQGNTLFSDVIGSFWAMLPAVAAPEIPVEPVAIPEPAPIVVPTPIVYGPFTLTVSVTPAVGGVVRDKVKPLYTLGEYVELTAISSVPVIWTFDYWEVNGVSRGGANPISIGMFQKTTVVAHFREKVAPAPEIPTCPPGSNLAWSEARGYYCTTVVTPEAW